HIQGVWSIGAKSSVAHDSGTKDSGAFVPLKEIQGDSNLFHVIMKPGVDPGAELKEISWQFGPESDYRVMLHVYKWTDSPMWVTLQDKYKQRVHVPTMTTLRTENLTLEDSGRYQAIGDLTEGKAFIQMFHLIVFKPVLLPQILAKSFSITPGWCSVTLESRATGASENLNMTWENKGLPKNLDQTGTLGPDSNSRTLTLSLPVSQHLSRPNASLTCVVSNSIDKKNATLHLGEFCCTELGFQLAKIKFAAEERK
ncbi:uncharacterized protein LOC111819401, partial [Trichechus manatus latirostris]|uniref:Uncharacterized protein LOC111819401 n=1 Tax=Trichechus manatus latirostris TaxID=127582 RepID=A0A2Y9QIJ8_TRIMA